MTIDYTRSFNMTPISAIFLKRIPDLQFSIKIILFRKNTDANEVTVSDAKSTTDNTIVIAHVVYLPVVIAHVLF
jgi:hypothetical protein